MITINLSRAFFILMCSYALFGEVFGKTALSSITYERDLFRLPPCRILTSPAKSYREDAGNGGYGFPSISGTRISNNLQVSWLGGSTFSSDTFRSSVVLV